jgi:hypothetical protein
MDILAIATKSNATTIEARDFVALVTIVYTFTVITIILPTVITLRNTVTLFTQSCFALAAFPDVHRTAGPPTEILVASKTMIRRKAMNIRDRCHGFLHNILLATAADSPIFKRLN